MVPAAQVAYLASTLFLDSNSDLIVLIVNTITRDLADDNMLIGAHTCCCNFFPWWADQAHRSLLSETGPEPRGCLTHFVHALQSARR